MSTNNRQAVTRLAAGSALLLAVCVGVGAILVSGPFSSGAIGAGQTAAGLVAPTALQKPPNQAPRPTGSPTAIALPSVSPTAGPTAAAPPTAKPTPRPTPEPNRLYHVPVLMYHRIIPTSEAGNSAPGLVVSPEMFSAQLKALRDAGWQSITMATLADDMATDQTIPAKTFVITIDDGWSDGYDYAFPIMREYGFVGTYFVIGSRIDEKDFLSTDQLRALEAAGNEIGNHTENHVSLSSVPLWRVKSEVENASVAIEKAVGHRPVSLAYPMGGVSAASADVVSQIPDMKIAVTTHPGGSETWAERYHTPRVRINPSTDPAKLVASLSYS